MQSAPVDVVVLSHNSYPKADCSAKGMERKLSVPFSFMNQILRSLNIVCLAFTLGGCIKQPVANPAIESIASIGDMNRARIAAAPLSFDLDQGAAQFAWERARDHYNREFGGYIISAKQRGFLVLKPAAKSKLKFPEVRRYQLKGRETFTIVCSGDPAELFDCKNLASFVATGTLEKKF